MNVNTAIRKEKAELHSNVKQNSGNVSNATYNITRDNVPNYRCEVIHLQCLLMKYIYGARVTYWGIA